MKTKPKDTIENDVGMKQCVGCGTVFLVFKHAEKDAQYCTPKCKKSHSIFDIEENQ